MISLCGRNMEKGRMIGYSLYMWGRRKGILYVRGENDLHFWEGSGRVPIWREGMIFLFERRNPYRRKTAGIPYGRGED